MFCPACKDGKMQINKKSTLWKCGNCGYKLSAKEFEDDYVFWFCDECQSYLNNQEGFKRKSPKHICRNCGYENDTTFSNIKGICIDCGKIIPNSEATLCQECKQVRIEIAKRWAINAAKVVGAVAAVAGVAYLASQSAESNDDTEEVHALNTDGYNDDDEEVYGLGEGIYPTCNTCGAEMTGFDGWAWYTCPECENKVRIIEGKESWYNDLFGNGKKSHKSDFELADFCRGGDLSED